MSTKIFYNVVPFNDELASYRQMTDVIYECGNKKDSEKVQSTYFKTLTLVDLWY